MVPERGRILENEEFGDRVGGPMASGGSTTYAQFLRLLVLPMPGLSEFVGSSDL